MKTKILSRALPVCGALGFFAGCASEPASVVVSAPPPPPPSATAPVVYTTPAPVPTTTTIYTDAAGRQVAVPSPVGASSIVVMQAPPAAQQEVPTPRPTANHVWVAGYWTWKSNQYQWMAGHWEVPPRAGAVFVPPRWQPEGTSWRFYEGYWD